MNQGYAAMKWAHYGERARGAEMTTASAWDFLWKYRQGLYARRHKSLWDALRPKLPKGGVVVDPAVGSGGLYEGWTGTLLGSDISPIAVEICQRKFPDWPFVVSDCRSLPYSNQIADVVVLSDIIQHFKGFEPVLREAHRVLKVGGKMVVVVGRRNSAQNTKHERWTAEKLVGYILSTFHTGYVDFEDIAGKWILAVWNKT